MSLSQLLADNASGRTAQNTASRHGGFRIHGTMTPGITTFMKKKLGLYRKRPPKGGASAVVASSRSAGSALHRALYHRLLCSRGRCDCARAFGARKAPRRTARTEAFVSEACAELGRLGLVAVCGEQVVHSTELPVATAIDLLCRRERDPGAWVLVSWKSGRSGAEDEGPLEPRLMLDSSAPGGGEAFCIAQITAEIAMLGERGVHLDAACIIHVQEEKRAGPQTKARGIDRYGNAIKEKRKRTGNIRCLTRFLPRDWVRRGAREIGWKFLRERYASRKKD